jgi:DNA-binding NtrC family response regulator
MKQVFDLIIQAAPSRSTMLITGESGTGKSWWRAPSHALVAPDKAFVTVNSGNCPPSCSSRRCSVMSRARSPARCTQEGALRHGGQGTIFFDEIGNIRWRHRRSSFA